MEIKTEILKMVQKRDKECFKKVSYFRVGKNIKPLTSCSQEIQLKMKDGQTQLIPEFFKLEYNSDKIIEGIMSANNSIEFTITENRDFKLL